MGFFDDFFGKTSKKHIDNSKTIADRDLQQGRDKAEVSLNDGIQNSMLSLTDGYGQATGRLTGGADRARGEVTDAYGNAETAITDALGRTRGTLDPWITSGRKAQDRYDTALGLDGQAGAEAFYEDYGNNDPMRKFRDELANKQLQAQFNARGQSGSGRFGTAVSRASLERGTQDLQTYLSRLEQQGARGGQYAGALAGYETGAGKDIAQLRAGAGDRRADITMGSTNKLADLDYGYGRDRSSIQSGQGEKLANLHYGYGQQRAGNQISYGNAMAGASNIGTNNLLNLAGTVASAFGSYMGIPKFGKK